MFTTLSVLADLCTLYRTARSSIKFKSDEKRRLLEFINLLNHYKQMHTDSQKLREECRTNNDRSIVFSEFSAKKYHIRLYRLFDKLSPFENHLNTLDSQLFSSVDLDINSVDYIFRQPLETIQNSLIKIRQYSLRLQKSALELKGFADEWNKSKWNQSNDLEFYMNISSISEDPARHVLLYTDASIMNSITIMNVMGTDILK